MDKRVVNLREIIARKIESNRKEANAASPLARSVGNVAAFIFVLFFTFFGVSVAIQYINSSEELQTYAPLAIGLGFIGGILLGSMLGNLVSRIIRRILA